MNQSGLNGMHRPECASRWTGLAICSQQFTHTFPDSLWEDMRTASGCSPALMNTTSHPWGHQEWLDWRGGGEVSPGTYHILVEEIEDHVGESCVTPVPMHKKELAEMSELRDGKVTGHYSLQTGREDYPEQLNMLEHTQPSSIAWQSVNPNQLT